VRATFRPVLRAVRATLRPALGAVRATFLLAARATVRPVLLAVRAVLLAARDTVRPVLRAVRATVRPVLRTVRAVLRAVRFVVAIVFLRFCFDTICTFSSVLSSTQLFCTLCRRTVRVNVYLTELNKATRMTMHAPRVNRSPICGVPTPTRSRLY
jgi:hypothetical protein